MSAENNASTVSSTADVELVPEESILAFTHAKRMWVVKELTKKGELPEDVAQQKLLLNALDGMDKAALGRKRIKVDERSNKNMEEAAALVAKILSSTQINTAYKVDTPTQRQVPVLGNDIPAPTLVDGETALIPIQKSYETFMTDFKQTENAQT